MKVAIVHYWLVSMRGGEKVVEALCELYPEADIFTHVVNPAAISNTIKRHRIQTTFIQKLPSAARRYREYLPLMPLALKRLELTGYDLVISSESGPAKGVRIGVNARHICYCHTPMRYVWDLYDFYRQTAGWPKRWLMPPLVHWLRKWDLATAGRVDEFVANSRHVAGRIERTYRRTSRVIYPPVDVQRFDPNRSREDFYLTVSQFVPYKRLDVVVEAFNQLGLPLVMIGSGPDWERVRRQAAPNVRLLGWQSDEVVKDHLERCRAFVFAAEEEFGIAPVEAQAAGAPVIAYGVGGVAETVIAGETGVFFLEQTAGGLAGAVRVFAADAGKFDAKRIARHAGRFSKERFQKEFSEFAARMSRSGRD